MKNGSQLSEKVRKAVEVVAKAHQLRLVMLYGSVARRAATPSSDIDVGVLGASPLTFEDEAVIAEELARATGLFRIEVKSLHQASPLFLNTVMREGIVLYEDTFGRAQAFGLYAWKIATESRLLREERYARVRETIASRI